jgi:hypothetical protein
VFSLPIDVGVSTSRSTSPSAPLATSASVGVGLVRLTHPGNPIGISLGRILRKPTKVPFRDHVWPTCVSPDASAAAAPV